MRNGLSVIGGAIPMTYTTDALGTAMTNEQVGTLVAVADMSTNGKILTFIGCTLSYWIPGGVDLQSTYVPCFEDSVSCYNDPACVQASADTKVCADDVGAPIQAHSMLTTLYAPLPGVLTHQQLCDLANCATEVGNTKFMAAGLCLMDVDGFQFNKCYDDMMAQIGMFMMMVGGISFVVGVLMFTGVWCCLPLLQEGRHRRRIRGLNGTTHYSNSNTPAN